MDKRYQDLDIQSLSIGLSGELKISVGQTFHVQLKGQEAKGKQEIKVSKILRDESNHFYFGVLAYSIYVVINGKEQIWQSMEGVPVRVTYNLIYPENEVYNNSGSGFSHGRNGQEEEEEDR
jgi:hypothetical protein